jgi:hypothetical protein
LVKLSLWFICKRPQIRWSKMGCTGLNKQGSGLLFRLTNKSRDLRWRDKNLKTYSVGLRATSSSWIKSALASKLNWGVSKNYLRLSTVIYATKKRCLQSLTRLRKSKLLIRLFQFWKCSRKCCRWLLSGRWVWRQRLSRRYSRRSKRRSLWRSADGGAVQVTKGRTEEAAAPSGGPDIEGGTPTDTSPTGDGTSGATDC